MRILSIPWYAQSTFFFSQQHFLLAIIPDKTAGVDEVIFFQEINHKLNGWRLITSQTGKKKEEGSEMRRPFLYFC